MARLLARGQRRLRGQADTHTPPSRASPPASWACKMSLPTAPHQGLRGKGAAGSRGRTPRTGRGCEGKHQRSGSFEVRHGALHHAKNNLVLLTLTGAAWCLRASGNLWSTACPTSRPSPSALFAWGICGGTLIRTDGKGRGWHLWFRPAIYTAFGGGSVLPSCGLNRICPSIFARTRGPCRQIDSGFLPAGRWVSTKQAFASSDPLFRRPAKPDKWEHKVKLGPIKKDYKLHFRSHKTNWNAWE